MSASSLPEASRLRFAHACAAKTAVANLRAVSRCAAIHSRFAYHPFTTNREPTESYGSPRIRPLCTAASRAGEPIVTASTVPRSIAACICGCGISTNFTLFGSTPLRSSQSCVVIVPRSLSANTATVLPARSLGACTGESCATTIANVGEALRYSLPGAST